MDLNYIRAGIFLVAGLALVIFPKTTLRWQQRFVNFLVTKLHLKFMKFFIIPDIEKGAPSFRNIGIFFLVIAAGLFLYAFLY